MELVIKIPEEAKQAFDCAESNDLKGCYYDHGGVIGNAIKNGKPLPKGHGRLKDADEILKAMNTWDKFGYTETGCFVREPQNDYVPYVHYEDMVKAVNGAPTIIEADADGDNAICGCCNRLNHLYGTYCKHCGAKMIVPQESEE